MYYGAPPEIIEKAKGLRNNMTKTEKLLWSRLRKKQIKNTRFYRQHPINIFIADFYCHKFKLVVEVDGKIHNKSDIQEHDENRTAELERFGLKVIRFTNDEIFSNIEYVIKEIEKHMI